MFTMDAFWGIYCLLCCGSPCVIMPTREALTSVKRRRSFILTVIGLSLISAVIIAGIALNAAAAMNYSEAQDDIERAEESMYQTCIINSSVATKHTVMTDQSSYSYYSYVIQFSTLQDVSVLYTDTMDDQIDDDTFKVQDLIKCWGDPVNGFSLHDPYDPGRDNAIIWFTTFQSIYMGILFWKVWNGVMDWKADIYDKLEIDDANSQYGNL